jgi:hypothetical protein
MLMLLQSTQQMLQQFVEGIRNKDCQAWDEVSDDSDDLSSYDSSVEICISA